MKIKSPCIKGLKRYESKGCPETEWNETRQEGCPCWVSMPIVDKQNPTKHKTIWLCVEMIAHHQRHQMLCLLEGNQHAIESFRNGMVETVNGQSIPKNNKALELIMHLAGQKVL